MKEFIAKFSSHLLGVLSGFDRVLIRGSLRGICYPEGMMPRNSGSAILMSVVHSLACGAERCPSG